MADLASMSPKDLCEYLIERGISRFYLVWDTYEACVKASHPELEELARKLEKDTRDYDQHEGVFVQVGPDTRTLQAAFLHRTCRGQGAGGSRYWTYDTVGDFLSDGLRLSKGMTQKNALAGLWWGGGKGVIARGSGVEGSGRIDPDVRRRMYEEYGELMTSIRGCYVTAEDVGTTVEDMAAIFSRTRFTTCVPERLGGSGNPSVPTARGTVRGMEAALAHLGMGTIEGKTIAVQGVGNVGEAIVGFVHDRGARRVIASDIDPGCEQRLRARFPDLDLEVRVVERGDNSILAEKVDIISPNATGATINERTIPAIRAPIVCGAANNQLEDPEVDDTRLHERDILYMPDFLINRMGIVNCADEQNGRIDDDPVFENHLGDDWDNSIFNLSLRVLNESVRTGSTPHRVAVDMADARSFELHPLMGHRGLQIIQDLVRGNWAR